MAYGIKILTQNGLIDIQSYKTVQRVSSYLSSAINGSVATPSAVSASNGGVLIEVLDGKEPAQCFIRSDGNTVWQNYSSSGQQSASFYIHWLRFK